MAASGGSRRTRRDQRKKNVMPQAAVATDAAEKTCAARRNTGNRHPPRPHPTQCLRKVLGVPHPPCDNPRPHPARQPSAQPTPSPTRTTERGPGREHPASTLNPPTTQPKEEGVHVSPRSSRSRNDPVRIAQQISPLLHRSHPKSDPVLVGSPERTPPFNTRPPSRGGNGQSGRSLPPASRRHRGGHTAHPLTVWHTGSRHGLLGL